MKTVVAAALGECVHVAGVSNFLRLAEAAGWRTVFLGRRCRLKQVLQAARQDKADLVGVSYRLTPETGERLLGEFAEAADELRSAGRALCLWRHAAGGRARPAPGFLRAGLRRQRAAEAVLAYLKGQAAGGNSEDRFPPNHGRTHPLESRPIPLLRHHFGLPTLEATLDGIRPDRRGAGAGCDLAGHRPGCPGEFLPPRTPGPAPQGGRRRAGAHRGRLPGAVRRQPDAAITRCCAPIPARTISSAWRRCTLRRSTSPGAPSRCSGSTRWTGAGPGTWKARSASTSR